MKTPKVHEIYKGFEIELYRGKLDKKDTWACAQGREATIITTRYVTAKEALQSVKVMIDERKES